MPVLPNGLWWIAERADLDMTAPDVEPGGTTSGAVSLRDGTYLALLRTTVSLQ
ncbi:hypothetical protein [Corallococcus sp. CA049B]|uniref:hypothetical protein n=1 Tax=Corallococcus sp. CA049B TaxID=2316730 RepID=UPI001315ADAC|nr:hypothetical protein [Corallococcus sp. CA049B]